MRILMHYRHFPVSIGRYLKRGFQRLGHQVFSVGSIDPRGPEYIPWGDYRFPTYAEAPDLLIPEVPAFPLGQVLASLPFQPDLVVQAGDVTWLEGKAPVCNVIVMTDPHCVDYRPRLAHADVQVCMQDTYRGAYPDSHWVPYAYDEEFHYFLPGEPLEYDVVFIGAQYDNRRAFLERMSSLGYRVYNNLGVVYHEGTRIYNRGLVAFNWSSLMDLPARFFEGMAYNRLVLTNRVPDIEKLGFREDVHYVAFSSLEEAVEKCSFYTSHLDPARACAARGWEAVGPHTWRARAAQILSLAGFGG